MLQNVDADVPCFPLVIDREVEFCPNETSDYELHPDRYLQFAGSRASDITVCFLVGFDKASKLALGKRK